VLIATEQAEFPSLENNSEFWQDTVLMYCMLRENGFEDQDIYVLYGDGDDEYAGMAPATYQSSGVLPPADYYLLPQYCGSAGLNSKITDFPVTLPLEKDSKTAKDGLGCYQDGATGKWYCRWPACFIDDDSGEWKCRPKDIFDCLAHGCPEPRKKFECPTCSAEPIPALTANDFLFVWWKGHAEASGGDEETFRILLSGNEVAPETMSEWLSDVPAVHRAFVVETCKSGCLKSLPDDLFGAAEGCDPIVLASCACDELSWSADGWTFEADHLHGPWSFWVASTLRKELPQGFLIDGRAPTGIQHYPGGPLALTFGAAEQATTWQVSGQSPVLKDPQCLASETRIDVRDPSAEIGKECRSSTTAQCSSQQ
jgi:hypothetical protein